MQLFLRDLQPSSAYAIQVRADDGDAVSDWSNVFEFITEMDTNAPKAPTGVTWVSVGDSFHGEWNAVTQNLIDETTQIVRYEVELAASSTKIKSVPQNTDGKAMFDLGFDDNRALFGTPQPAITFRVRAIDRKELKSEWSTAYLATNLAPGPPTALTATSVVDGISLDWTNPADVDIIGYNIYVGSTAGFVPGVGNRVTAYPTPGTEFVYSTLTYSLLYFKVRAVDKFNQESTDVSASGTAKTSIAVDAIAPGVPTSFAAPITTDTFGRARAEVTWAMVAPPSDLAGFNIRYRKVADTNYLQTTVDKDSRALTLDLPVPYANYEFQIRAFDWSANLSAWSGTVTSTGSTNAVPAQTLGVVLTPGRDNMTIAWTEAVEDDVKNGAGVYEVQIDTANTFATGNLKTYRTGANSISLSGITTATTFYVRVRAVDSVGQAGSYSATSSAATVAFPLTPLSDGSAPASSPTPTVLGSIGYLFVSWTPITNNDAVTYEVHVSVTTGFTPSAGTKVAEISGSVVTLEKDGAGAALAYGTTYYVKTIAKDRDGSAAASAQGSGIPLKATSGDVETITITQLTTGDLTSAVLTIKTGGQIKSELYTSSGGTSGFSLTDSALIIRSGIISAGVLEANSSFVTTLNIGAGGSIKSANYVANTTGFKIDNTGIDIGSNGFINAGSIKAGIITATTINIGATGILNIDSTGQIKSNDYALNSTGYKLSNTGLEVNVGSIDAKAIKTSSLLATTITLGSGGIIQSSDYPGGTAGFKLDSAGLVIRSGTIEAASLKIQSGANIAPVRYATMPLPIANYAFLPTTEMSISVVGTDGGVVPKIADQQLKFTVTNLTAARAQYLCPATTGLLDSQHTIEVEGGTTYILSAWVYTATATTAVDEFALNAYPVDDAGATGGGLKGSTQIIPAATWTRVYSSITTASNWKRMIIGLGDYVLGVTRTFYVSGIQVEGKIGQAVTPSAFNPPASTRIDAGVIRTGQLRSTDFVLDLVTGLATDQPAWFIDLEGDAQFGNVAVRGSMVVGAVGESQISQIQSFNYIPGADGWAIKSDGVGEFMALSAKMLSGSSIMAGTDGAERIEISDDGMFIYGIDPDTDIFNPLPNISFPSNGAASVIKGQITADTFLVTNGGSMGGTVEIPPNGIIRLTRGVGAPTSPPQVTSYYQKTAAVTGGLSTHRTGGHYDGGYYYFCDNWLLGIERINVATGVCETVKTITTIGDEGKTLGVTRIGTIWYVLCQDATKSSDYWVYKYDSSWAPYTSGAPANDGWRFATYAQIDFQPGFGNDGTNVVTCRSFSGDIIWTPREPLNGVAGTPVTTNISISNAVTSIAFGSFDFGSSKVLITTAGTGPTAKVYVTNTSGTRQTADEWPIPNPNGSTASVVWDGTKILSLTSYYTEYIYKFSSMALSVTDQNRYIRQTWANAATGPTEETGPGLTTIYTLPKRKVYTVSPPSAPSTPATHSRFYVGQVHSGSPPLSSEYYLRGAATTIAGLEITSDSASGDNPPSPTLRPFGGEVNPGRIESFDSLYYVDADGVAKFKTLQVMNRRPIILARTTTQSIPDSVWTAVSWNSIVENPDGGGAAAGWTCAEDGFYTVAFNAGFVAQTGARRILRVTVAGTEIARAESGVSTVGAASWFHSLVVPDIEILVGQIVKGEMYQTTGAALDTFGSTIPLRMSVRRVADS